MSNVYLKWLLALLVLAFLAGLFLRFTRKIPTYSPPIGRPSPDAGMLDRDIAQQMQAVLDEQVNRLNLPGLQAYVRLPAGAAWSGASGTVDLKRKTQLQDDHILRVGSVTKPFTAVLILKLVEAGQLSLDDRLSQWFPDFPGADQITIRQLLNHSSGIADVLEFPAILGKTIIPWISWKPSELVQIVAGAKLHFTPGSAFHYSNTNYILLGLIAEQVTGQPVVRLLREEILDPLNLTNTFFVPYESAPDRLVRGYDRDLTHIPGLFDIGKNNTSWATSAFTSGALASTAADLGNFFSVLSAGELLGPATMDLMTTFISAPNPGFEPQKGSGLGLVRLVIDGQELYGHPGEFMGSSSLAVYSPAQNYIIVVTSNLSFPDLVSVVSDLQKIVRNSL
jgi:D-alanyl-D-alanine carboxypeptidase